MKEMSDYHVRSSCVVVLTLSTDPWRNLSRCRRQFERAFANSRYQEETFMVSSINDISDFFTQRTSNIAQLPSYYWSIQDYPYFTNSQRQP